jgi:hypothetical protein
MDRQARNVKGTKFVLSITSEIRWNLLRLSVGSCIILAMTNYQKYTWVCTGDCDALIEYTIKDGYGWPAGVMDLTCRCNSNCTLLSVEDATITPSTTTKEETMETTTPQVMTLDWIENDVVTNKTYTESDIRNMVWVNKNLTAKQNEWYKKESELRTFIHDNFENSDDQESLTAIAEMFDIPMTKEIDVTIWVRVDATVEVELSGDSFDAVEQFVQDNLTVDSYGSEMAINNFEVERCEEGAY